VDIEIADRIRTAAAELGYVRCGFTDATPFERYARALDEHIRRFPEASSLYEPMRRRIDPRRTAPWARSIVVCIRGYNRFRLPPRLSDHIGRTYLVDNRRPGCPDHRMPRAMTELLRGLGLRVKRGGVPDRAAAERAGVAWILKSGFAWTPETGTWLNIETWRIDADLPPGRPLPGCPCPDDCTACIEACPTGALTAPLAMRMDRCVAYLTYEAPWPIAPDLWKCMGPWVYGCDACQQACPLNRGRWRNLEPGPWLDAIAEHLTPEALAEMDQKTYENVVYPRFWYIPREHLWRWRANARRAVEWQRQHGGG